MNNPTTAEETPSPAFEKTTPKLNLPPKPVLANPISSVAPEQSESLPVEESPIEPTEPAPIAPPIAPPSFPLLSATPESSISSDSKEKNSPKKKFSIGLPLAFLTILIAFLAFLMQLRMLLL